MNKRKALAWLLWLAPMTALAWWNDEWPSRKQIDVDVEVTGADIRESLTDFPLLLRLHTGNFGYFGELADNGKDIRFLADDKTPLKHHIEKLDAVNEMALLWVKMPKAGAGGAPFWMYYGNGAATDGADAKGTYGVNQALTYHFAEGEAVPQDATGYANHAASAKSVVEPGGWIGAAARFQGQGGIVVPAHPALAVNPEQGWTFAAWIKLEGPQAEGVVLQAREGANALELLVQGTALIGRAQGAASARTAPVELGAGQWRHVALVAGKDKLEVYLDGAPAAGAPLNLAAFAPSLTLGASAAGQGFAGLLDEVQIANVARSADWLKLTFRSQSPDFNVLTLGQDESKGASGDTNYFAIILQSLTVDGWVVIALCGAMFVISALVMLTKAIVLSRAARDNRAFLAQYHGLDAAADPGALDRDESEEEKELEDSDYLAAIVGKHDHFQSSPIYHVYHAGVQELKKRYGSDLDNKPLTAEAVNVLRARLDAAVVREGQRLNRHMVLLTIAISGGPFLGLLGTVLGVMITFAVIAATGDVNINSIAPGISGALLATVAGLAVAIPALFGYNYLLTQIKDITAEMRVFTDEFLALAAERIADRQRGG